MSAVQVSCPACGGPIVFQMASSLVAVCPYCRSVVARGDRQPENLGKVAELVETGSPLDVGLHGRYQGVPFTLTGRAQLGHAAGGLWDEWYAAFADGRWGWLAEAQGRFYLTFQQPPGQPGPPPFGQLQLGQSLHVGGSPAPLLVAETGAARALSARGEIPYRLVPNESYEYADLSGPSGEFATLDYSEAPPLVFVGREVPLNDLGFPAAALNREREARQVQGVQLGCPHCGGALALRAPDKTERVTCPSCASLLDVHEGQLRFLKALEPGKFKPLLPLGSVGEYEGQPFTVIGFLERSVKIEHVKYAWAEYLLYHPQRGFRWLVCSGNHWSYVQPLSPGEVTAHGRVAAFHGNDFKLFEKAVAHVDYVLGEFYWKVSVGEQVGTADYLRPPQMLSQEISRQEGAQEVNWSLGTYLPVVSVEQTFRLTGLPRPPRSSVAPQQPFPHKRVYLSWVVLSLAALLVGVVIMTSSPRRQVYQHLWQLSAAGSETPSTVFSEPFQLRGRHNVRVTVKAWVNNSWVDVDGDLINEETGLVQAFAVPVAYYHGVDGGESWSEGSQEQAVYLSALPPGTYTLRLECQRETPQQPVSVQVVVEQGVMRPLYLLLTLAALAILPGIVLIYHVHFERQRWKDSAYSPYHSS